MGIALLVGLLSPPASAVEVITNGGFETGNFNGWNVGIRPDRTNGGAPYLFDTPSGWVASKETQTDGALSLSPVSGYSAFHGFSGSPAGLQFFLSQPFTCNTLLSRAQLSFTFDVVGGPQADNAAPRHFEVWIRSSSGHDRAKLFSYSVFGPDANPPQTVSIDIRSAFNSLGPSLYLLEFRGVVPEGDTGPALFVLDNVSLDLQDNRFPRVTCPPDQTLECVGPLTPVVLQGSASDPDGDPLTLTWLRGNTVVGTGPVLTISLPVGKHTFTLVATDIFGAMAMCDVMVTLIAGPPTITCPANLTLECGADTSPPATGLPTAADPCGGPVTVSHTDTVIPGVCPVKRTILRVWKATGIDGAMATCTQTITVRDTLPPVLVGCPMGEMSMITVPNLAAVPPPATVTATDVCDGTVPVQFTQTQTPTGPCGFTIVRTWKATDLCGNMATCTQTITVTGGPAGSLMCQNVRRFTPTKLGITVTFNVIASPGVTGLRCVDGTGKEVHSGDFFAVGLHTITCTAIDACGNIVTCTFTIEVFC